MKGDPFYADIVKALGERLDPDEFERCATDLLRADYPGLVGVPGGSDRGMDGAIPTSDGVPFPLICTTSDRAVENLTKNLRARLDSGSSPGSVVFATCKRLSPQKRRALETRATELGFTLHQIYDQSAFADRLYHRPEWCRSLLHLPGNPPPLTAVPLTRRPLPTVPLVGRDEELEWLMTKSGDRVVSGQPGAGKTSLLHDLVRRGKGLFLATNDRAEILKGIRAQRPTAVIVDDAHIDLDVLVSLRQLRAETGARFDIIAASWPGKAQTVADTLVVGATSQLNMRLLTRDEIVEVIRACGFNGPTEYVREIVDQAEGRPGLAVTLAKLALVGALRDVAVGDVLVRLTDAALVPILGDSAVELLATFALAGKAGLAMEDAAAFLSIPLVAVRRRVTVLAAAGVLTEVGQSLAVRPPSLRYVLVRDVFFAGATSLPVSTLLNRIHDKTALAKTLIGAQMRGADVPPPLLQSVVSSTQSSAVWSAYTALGRAEAEWALRERADLLPQLAPVSLNEAPRATIPLLLEAAVGDARPTNAHPSHPLRILEDWICDPRPVRGELVEKRQLALRATDWVAAGGNSDMGVQAVALAFSPALGWGESDPGAGRTWTMYRGVLSVDGIGQVRALWPEAMTALRTVSKPPWRELVELVREWTYSSLSTRQPIKADVRDAMGAFVVELLASIRTLAKDRPGVLRQLDELDEVMEQPVTSRVQTEFDVLFPPRRYEDRLKMDAAAERVAEILPNWAKLPARVAVRRLAELEHEAEIGEIRWPRLTPYLCGQLAERVEEPQAWAYAFLQFQCPLDLAEPFLRRVVRERAEGWHETVRAYLDRPDSRGAIVPQLLVSEGVDAAWMDLLMDGVRGCTVVLRALCAEGRVPAVMLERLLTHSDDGVATATALGISEGGGPSGRCDVEMWRNAILRCDERERGFEEVFAADPGLALEWLTKQIGDTKKFLGVMRPAVYIAIASLGIPHRVELVRRLPNSAAYTDLVWNVIGNNLDLYRILLEEKQVSRLHLAPLHENELDKDWPSEEWKAKARVAVAAGYTVPDIVKAMRRSGFSWRGEESARWRKLAERFEAFAKDPDETIRAIGANGREWAFEEHANAIRREGLESVHDD